MKTEGNKIILSFKWHPFYEKTGHRRWME